ncbi:MAG: hypothetical protein AAF384_13700 [Pseudomonadota bacterium]
MAAQTEPRKKDPYWWMHPAFRGEQAMQISDAGVMTEGIALKVQFENGERQAQTDANAMPAEGGPFEQLAKLLFKINNYCPGPVRGWYVVVCTQANEQWAVGQLRADANYPVQIFEDLTFPTEALAREKAQALKKQFPGVQLP